MSGYQEFSPGSGHSRSAAKLIALALPRLAGATVLDVGCGEGFFCGFAAARGAARIVGVDAHPPSLDAAAARFPDCNFILADWANAPAGPFSVILFLSALHYAPDQPAALEALIGRLSPSGVLVLELGIADGSSDAWITVERADGEFLYPTRARLEALLAPHAYKIVGRSVAQAGDPVPRWVVHVRRRLPMVLLLPSGSFTGKSTLARILAASGVPVRSVDAELPRLVSSPPSGPLATLMGALPPSIDPLTDGGAIVAAAFAAGLGPALLLEVLGPSRPPICVLEGALPPGRAVEARSALLDAGIAAWEGGTPFPGGAPTLEDSSGALVDAGGATAFLSDGAVDGRVDGVSVALGRIRVSGWAVDRTTSPAESARAFTITVGGRPLPTSASVVLRPDLAEAGVVSANVAAGFDLDANLSTDVAADLAAGADLAVTAAGLGLKASVIRTGRRP